MQNVMTGAQAIVECMRIESIEHVFCVPGESYLGLMDAIYDAGDIKLIANRQEGGASFMAEAYAKATGKPGVAMATRGVGGANLAIGIHTAHQDSTPMVVFLGQVDSNVRGREAFQEVELDQFFGHIAKWAVEIRDTERIPELVQRAFRVAKTGRPGPVVVSLPPDVLTQTAEMHFGPCVVPPRPRPSVEEVSDFMGHLAAAKKPVIIAGGGVTSSHAEQSLLQFAEKHQIPVMASFRRHDVFPNSHPLYVGHLGLGTSAAIQDTVRQADTVIAIGTRFSEVTTQGYTLISPHQRLLHVDIDTATLGKVYAPTVGIVADAREAMQALTRNNGVASNPEWAVWAATRRRVYDNSTTLAKSNHPAAVDMKQVIRTLQETLPNDAIITNDAGNFSGWLHSFYQFNTPHTYIGPTSGAMGYGLPSAIGAQLAHPHRTVVSLSGDGGFMMTVQELMTAVQYNVPIIALVFNNSMYGTIRMHQERAYPHRVIGTDLQNPDFVTMGESFGAFSQRVTADEQFERALMLAIQSKQPSLIEIVYDPEQISVLSTISQIRSNAR